MNKIKYVILMIIGIFFTIAFSFFLASYIAGNRFIKGNNYLKEARRAIKKEELEKAKLLYIDGIKFDYSDEIVKELVEFERKNLDKEELNRAKDLIDNQEYINATEVLNKLKIKKNDDTLIEEINYNIEVCKKEILKEKKKIIEESVSNNEFESAKEVLDSLIKDNYDKKILLELRNSYEKAYKAHEENEKIIAEEKRKKEEEEKKRKEKEK